MSYGFLTDTLLYNPTVYVSWIGMDCIELIDPVTGKGKNVKRHHDRYGNAYFWYKGTTWYIKDLFNCTSKIM